MSAWPVPALRAAMASLLPGVGLEFAPEVDSSNSELMRRARAGRAAPVLLVAERQRAGRGRLGRSWHSAATSAGAGPPALTFSLGLPLAPRDWSGLSLAVGVALAQALDAPAAGLQLKWPNDLWWRERKLGGVLIESVGPVAGATGRERYVVVGVGLNIEAPPAHEMSTPPAWLREWQPEATAASALQCLVAPLLAAVLRFGEEGFAPFAASFAARDVLAGRIVQLSDGRSGRAAGVTGGGALRLHSAAGEALVHSADVSVRPVAPALRAPDADAAA